MRRPKALKRKLFRYIDVFAGCGGLALGFHQAKWQGIFAIEKDSRAFETLQYNLIKRKRHFRWPKWLPKRRYCINTLLKSYPEKLKELRGRIEVVAGGPPCQGFSLAAGRRNKDDFRNKLVNSYIRFVGLVRPKVIFFENVKGFTVGFKEGKSQGIPYSEKVLRRLRKLGYKDVQGRLMDFSAFGVPQRRTRFILIGTLKGNSNYYYEQVLKRRGVFLKRKNLPARACVKQAISDLERRHGEFPSPDTKHFFAGHYGKSQTKFQERLRNGSEPKFPDSHRFSNHGPRTVKVFTRLLRFAKKNKKVPDEIRVKCGIKKRNITVLSGSHISPTLTTHPDDYIHYSEPRILTVREYARIQTFHDWYEFKGQYTTGGERRIREVPRYTQLGNAIPPLFAELSGLVIKDMI